MPASIIDGKKIAEDILQNAAARVAESAVTPCLAVIIVGENPASQVYVRNKIRACEKTGIVSKRYDLPADITESALLDKITALNDAADVHGILLQLPLPDHIDGDKILDAIAPEKDVDGFHEVHMGRLVADMPSLRPCTPSGCMLLLAKSGVQFAGSNAVIIGRSHIVGKPMALMLINAGATTIVCNSKTKNLADITRTADILVAAVGKPKMVTAEMVKENAVVIDVGINRVDGKIVGDVDYPAVAQKAAAITPVPGGVGPMTIAMLIENTLRAARVA